MAVLELWTDDIHLEVGIRKEIKGTDGTHCHCGACTVRGQEGPGPFGRSGSEDKLPEETRKERPERQGDHLVSQELSTT